MQLRGEAGIGKSTLWTAALERASTRGDRVLAWRASVAERDLAHALLGALLDEPVDDALLRSLAEPRRRALETALARRGPGPERLDPGLVGLAVTDALRRLAQELPLVVAIDDVQWADAASHAALTFAARRLRTEPMAILVAERTTPGTALPMASPGAEASLGVDRHEVIQLGPLSIGALGRLLHDRLGVAHPRPLLVRLHEASAGNPFIALEIGRSLAVRGLEPSPGDPLPIAPETVPLVLDHLARLTADARRLVVLVAMAADPTLDLIDRVLGAGAVAALDEAVREGLLAVSGVRVRPVHPLFGSVAFADSPPGERRDLRLRLAEIADDPVQRAVHRAAATVDRLDPAVAAELAAAADLATARGAPAIAADLLDRAISLTADDDLRARYRLAAADAAMVAGDADRAIAILGDLLEAVPVGRRRAEALLALGDIVYVERPLDAVVHLTAALDHTAGDPLLEALARSHLAGMADMDPELGYRSAMRAAEILERPDVAAPSDHLACALLDRAFHWLLAGERVAQDDIDRGMRLMTGRGASFVVRRAQEVAERCAFHLGRLAEAIALDEAESERLAERGQTGLMPPLLQSLSVLQLMAGDWPAARRHADECLELVEQGEEAWRDRARTAQARILAHDGRLDEARAIALEGAARQEGPGDRWEGAIFGALLGFIELSVPDPPAALRHLMRTLDHTDAMRIVLPTQFRFLGDLVEAAVLAGDLAFATEVLEDRLEAVAVRLPLPWVEAMAGRGRGLVEAASGRPDEAIRALDGSIAVFDERLPMPFERARTLLVRGGVHRRAGHRRLARSDVEAALTVFMGLGAEAWQRRAADELGRVGGRAPAGVALTAAERAVARLAADGRSNREIAAELVVSVRTVESQLAAAFRKLDVRSRGRLAAALRDGGSGDRSD